MNWNLDRVVPVAGIGAGRALVLFACLTAAHSWAIEPELSPEELLQLGRQIYREGRLASGEPVKAVTLGDVPVEGTQFTCLHCHRESGLGGSEGRIRVLPTDGISLFRSRDEVYRSRPAYDDVSLAHLIRHGADSAGRPLNPLMPRYELPDLEMAALISYLKTLSVEYSPGVTDDRLHLATVIAGDVDPAKRSAMLAVLNAFFKAKNGGTRAESRRAQSGPFYREYAERAYRTWELHVWEVSGPEWTWREQLQEEYRRQPVFAVVSGLSSLAWQPVQQFCEDMRVPCILPNIDAPPVTGDDEFYTLYYSKGLSLEAEILLSKPPEHSTDGRVVQLYRSNTAGGAAAATMRMTAAEQSGTPEVFDIALDPREPIDPLRLSLELRKNEADRVVLWLDSADPAFADLADWKPVAPVEVYLSSTLLNGDLCAVPESLRRRATLVQPFSLPADFEARVLRERTWFMSRGIASTPETFRIEAQTYFACRVLGEALMHVKLYFYRDYLMDSIDHFERMAAFTAVYPRLSFGPGQRYLAKGGYLVGFEDDSCRLSTDQAAWVVP